MNRFSAYRILLLLALAMAISTGCAGPRFRSTSTTGNSGEEVRTPGGNLIVYSAWDRFDTLDPEHQRHTPYVILSGPSDSANVVARVRNQSGPFGQEPELVDLPPGQYWVEARATNVGRVRVPVVIDSGRTARVFLDATTSPSEQAMQASNWVRQNPGPAFGWQRIEAPK